MLVQCHASELMILHVVHVQGVDGMFWRGVEQRSCGPLNDLMPADAGTVTGPLNVKPRFTALLCDS